MTEKKPSLGGSCTTQHWSRPLNTFLTHTHLHTQPVILISNQFPMHTHIHRDIVTRNSKHSSVHTRIHTWTQKLSHSTLTTSQYTHTHTESITLKTVKMRSDGKDGIPNGKNKANKQAGGMLHTARKRDGSITCFKLRSFELLLTSFICVCVFFSSNRRSEYIQSWRKALINIFPQGKKMLSATVRDSEILP